LEPGDLSDELLGVLKSHEQVVPHFHLPLQSGSDRLLRRMNRQYGRDDFLKMIDQVHAAFDRAALTTDIICGFPGEDDEAFAETLDVVHRSGFIHVHAFSFSPRPGTAAARWTREFVRGPVVNQRIEILNSLAERNSLAFRQSFLGQTVTVLVEREKPQANEPAGMHHGRCERYFPVFFEAPDATPGDFLSVRIDRVTPTATFGTCLERLP
jgi:tRNA A37 methylthiotransferase MiaB